MKFNDAVLGVVIFLSGLAIFLHAQSFPNAGSLHFGASLFPGIIGAGFMTLGVIMVITGLRARVVSGEHWVMLGAWARSPRNIVSMLLVPVMIVFYMWGSDFLGFFLTCFLILFIFMWWLGVRWPMAALISVISTFVIDLVFAEFLLVPLPIGLLQPLNWI